MSRIPPLSPEEAAPDARRELERQIADHGRATNMKRTLAHSPAALRAFMQWYDLHAEIVAFLGPRPALVFAHAISTRTDCLICSTFFRRRLIDSGEDPDALALNDTEGLLAEYGRRFAEDANAIDDALFARLAERFTPPQIVSLTAFAGLMVATNLFNNALRVDLDEYLAAYRKQP